MASTFIIILYSSTQGVKSPLSLKLCDTPVGTNHDDAPATAAHLEPICAARNNRVDRPTADETSRLFAPY